MWTEKKRKAWKDAIEQNNKTKKTRAAVYLQNAAEPERCQLTDYCQARGKTGLDRKLMTKAEK